jgi:REP element-mobilizing transposase RayT
MARPLRLEYPDAVYHLTARGNAREAIFLDEEDREAFLTVLGSVVARFRWLVHAYCLMTNHYHLLIETPEPNLSRGMRQLNGVYTQDFNRRHHRTGHILAGRFKAVLVERETHLLELARYVALNPVRAKAVAHARQWTWSSYRATAGETRAPAFLTTDWLLSQFASERGEAERLYRRFVAEGRGVGVWQDLRGGVLLGSEGFAERLAPLLHGKLALKEIPRAERLTARPSLAQLFSDRENDRVQRNQAIHEAVTFHGYGQSEVASHVGIHYSTVSRIVNRPHEGGGMSRDKT